MDCKLFMVSIETGFQLPNGESDAVILNIDDKDFMNKLIDLATEQGYKVTIELPDAVDKT